MDCNRMVEWRQGFKNRLRGYLLNNTK